MEVVVKLDARAAQFLREGVGRDPGLSELQETLRQLGVSLSPVHPSVQDPLLSSYFWFTAPDMGEAERMAALLRRSPLVEGAYPKPAAEPA